MKLVLAGLSVGFACGLLACANVVTIDSVPPAEGDEPETGVTQPSDPSDPGVSEPGEEATSKEIDCSFESGANAKQAIMAWVRGRDVVMVRGDGSSFVAFTFAEGKNADSAWTLLTTKDGFVAVTATVFSEANKDYYSESVLLSEEGNVLWKDVIGDVIFVQQRLGPKGTLARGFTNMDGSSTDVVWADGNHKKVPGVIPIGEPSLKGRFAALLTPDFYTQEFGWAEPDQEPKPFDNEPYGGSEPIAAEGKVFYLAALNEKADSFAVITESNDGISSVPFNLEGPYISTASDNFLMVRNQWEWNASHFLYSDQLGGLTQITMPTDVTAFGMAYYHGASVDDQGGVWLPARNKSSGGMFRSTDFGKNWKRMGKSISNIWDAGVVARGGTFVVAATDFQGYFPMDPWEAPSNGEEAAEVQGPNVEVLRPESGIAHTLNSASNTFVLSKKGKCLAYQLDNQIRVLAVESGKEAVVGEIDPAASYSPPVWLE